MVPVSQHKPSRRLYIDVWNGDLFGIDSSAKEESKFFTSSCASHDDQFRPVTVICN